MDIAICADWTQCHASAPDCPASVVEVVATAPFAIPLPARPRPQAPLSMLIHRDTLAIQLDKSSAATRPARPLRQPPQLAHPLMQPVQAQDGDQEAAPGQAAAHGQAAPTEHVAAAHTD